MDQKDVLDFNYYIDCEATVENVTMEIEKAYKVIVYKKHWFFTNASEAMKNFTWDVMAKKFMEVINENSLRA